MDQADPAASPESAVDRVAAGIRQAIREGVFAPGQRLIEADLTRQFEVSRGPIREALRQLYVEALVEFDPRRGPVVRGLSRAELDEIIALRATLEGLAARLVAERIDDPDRRATIEGLMQRWQRSDLANDVLVHVEEEVNFRHVITSVGGNGRLASLLTLLQFPGFRFRFFHLLDHAQLQRSVTEHRSIAAAILAGDCDKAEASMRDYVRWTGSLLRKLPDSAFRSASEGESPPRPGAAARR